MKKILIAKINSAFGIKGEVKIISHCQNPLDIEKYQLFDKNEQKFKLKISNKNKTTIGSTSNGGAILIAKIEGVEDRNKAEELRGLELFVERESFKELKKDDEFYQVDLIGLEVLNAENNKIGKVLNVLDFGGGVMLEIEFENANEKLNLEKTESFPFKDEFFPEIDVKKGFVRINLPEMVKGD